MREMVDVAIVGGGLSGVGSACHLQRLLPGKSFAILEARANLGGTWDLFRYPGIRSDSDMYTLGYAFKPWTKGKAIADGPSILSYIKETAAENRLAEHIRLNTRLVRADWLSEAALWRLSLETPQGPKTLDAKFLLMCAGYYRYDQGHSPHFEGQERFQGQIVHPQLWPEGLDYAGKRVVVIGSGATAVTLAPSMAETAGQVTMIQRSPTYMFPAPSRDWLAEALRRILPAKAAYAAARFYRISLQQLSYKFSRKNPEKAKQRLIEAVRQRLGPDYDVATHFTPSYNPWDQRICLVPDDDLFAAIRSGKVRVETGAIAGFSETGVRMASGAEIPADIIVTATGLTLQNAGGAQIAVDGAPVAFGERFAYRGAMISDVPNYMTIMGYLNASWTLRSDVLAQYACRLIAHMDAVGAAACTPRTPANLAPEPMVDFTSGYFQRALAYLPKQGPAMPWRQPQDYALDKQSLLRDPLEDGFLTFTKKPAAVPAEAMAAE